MKNPRASERGVRPVTRANFLATDVKALADVDGDVYYLQSFTDLQGGWIVSISYSFVFSSKGGIIVAKAPAKPTKPSGKGSKGGGSKGKGAGKGSGKSNPSRGRGSSTGRGNAGSSR